MLGASLSKKKEIYANDNSNSVVVRIVIKDLYTCIIKASVLQCIYSHSAKLSLIMNNSVRLKGELLYCYNYAWNFTVCNHKIIEYTH